MPRNLKHTLQVSKEEYEREISKYHQNSELPREVDRATFEAQEFYKGLTESEKIQLNKQLVFRKAKNNYIDYLRYVFPDYTFTNFHIFLAKVCQTVVERIEQGKKVRILLSVPPRHGKLIANDIPVLTKNGWKNHGDLQVGDYVLNDKGDFVKVLNVFPKYFANRKVYFSNGEVIICHENHEWVVHNKHSHNCQLQQLETKEMENSLKADKHFAYILPNKEVIKGEYKELLVNPYVLGAWLGDGKRDDSTICACEEDRVVIDECRKSYPNGAEWKHKTTNVIYACLNGLCKDLHNYGMCFYNKENKKFIPNDYLTASVEQRLELLAGLLDTDGHLRIKENRYVFTTADKELKDSFIELISTFGWRTCENEVEPTTSSSGVVGKRKYWQVSFNPTMTIPCRIERKVIKTFSKQRRITITKIEKCENVEGNCIQVEGGIYLVGKTMLPTHNSETITKTLPSWFVGRNPNKNAILTAYNSDLAEKFEDANRQKTREFGKDIFGIEISDSQDNKTLYQIKGCTGGVMGVGIQGGITGNGGELIIIDDPYKNSTDANSSATRGLIESIFRDSIYTRLQGKGNGLIVIQTRWHEEDLCGTLAKEDGWIVINIPCVCESEKKDVLNRKKGETLCPELGFDVEWANSTRNGVGLKVWEALYQGHPSIDGGEIFTREMIHQYKPSDLPSNFEEQVISCDLTFGGTKQSNDPVAIQVWGRVGANHYLLKRIKKRMSFNEMCDTIKIVSSSFPLARKKIVEKKANGQAVIDTLNSVIGGFEAYDPKMESKISRANSVAPFLLSGNVWLPCKDVDRTIDEMIEEMMKFPNSTHDDEVDAMTQYLITWNFHCNGRLCDDNAYKQLNDIWRGIKI